MIIKRDTFGASPRVTVVDGDHLPHWVKPTGRHQGWCEAQFNLFPQGQLSVNVIEAHVFADGTRVSTKRAMETLDVTATRAVFDMLKAYFEPGEAK